MSLFVALKYLHIVTLFFGVALAISGEIVVRRIAATLDVRAIRTTVARVKPISGPIATAFLFVGVGFGFAAALAGQFDLLRPWLIGAYVAFVAAAVIGITITDPWVVRLERAAAASPDDEPSPELRAVVADARARFGTWALMGLIAVLVFLMVVKPGS